MKLVPDVSMGDCDSVAAVIGATVSDVVNQVFNAVGGHIVPWLRSFSLDIVDV